MTVYLLENDVNIGGTLLRAGKEIDDTLYNVTQLQAAGAILGPLDSTGRSLEAAYAKLRNRGGSYKQDPGTPQVVDPQIGFVWRLAAGTPFEPNEQIINITTNGTGSVLLRLQPAGDRNYRADVIVTFLVGEDLTDNTWQQDIRCLVKRKKNGALTLINNSPGLPAGDAATATWEVLASVDGSTGDLIFTNTAAKGPAGVGRWSILVDVQKMSTLVDPT